VPLCRMTRMLLQNLVKFLFLLGGAFLAFLVIQMISRLLWGKDKGDAVAFWIWLVGMRGCVRGPGRGAWRP
jgi:hypothetical protein